MVWLGISPGGKTKQVFIDGTLNSRQHITDILQPHVILYAGAIGDKFMPRHDNARPHMSGDVKGLLANKGVEVMEWLVCSQDLNPNQHVQSYLKHKVYLQMMQLQQWMISIVSSSKNRTIYQRLTFTSLCTA